MLEVRNLKISYGGMDAVHRVSLEVQAGEIVSIIGANGAGKSSILNAISGITSAQSGQIIFDGEQIHGLTSHEVIAR
ncbi:MAG: ATP-binding cassette domain-containing protein [Gammaproteobacteria bacterium]|nr:ATP-binding cassette domain-containing protein [Gammaproteobacteria bacterium]